MMTRYAQLKPNGYIPRLSDALIEESLQDFGGIEICGARWSGKSWTAAAFGASVTRVDENQRIYSDDPTLALVGNAPHVIDEWQDVPSIWNLVRHRIDDSANEPGQFILTGSSSPLHAEGRHSGAGRIARIRMGTMTLAETKDSSGEISLAGMFEGSFSPVQSAFGLDQLSSCICRGGWPALRHNPRRSPSRVINAYLETLFDVTMPGVGKSSTLARNIALSLARNVATSATLRTIALDAANDEQAAPSTDTVASYLDEFSRNYFINELPGWDAPIRSRSRLRTKPKRYFDEPSLAAALLDVNPRRLISDGQLFGLLFESLCIHDLAVYASLLPGAGSHPLHYYADADGLEVDVIIELADGRWAAIEIKLGESKLDEAVANLARLKAKIAANPAARNPRPEFAAVLLGRCTIARYLADKDVYVIPIGALGA